MSKNVLIRIKNLEKKQRDQNYEFIACVENDGVFEVGTKDGQHKFHSLSEYEAFKKTKPDAEFYHIRIISAE